MESRWTRFYGKLWDVQDPLVENAATILCKKKNSSNGSKSKSCYSTGNNNGNTDNKYSMTDLHTNPHKSLNIRTPFIVYGHQICQQLKYEQFTTIIDIIVNHTQVTIKTFRHKYVLCKSKLDLVNML